MHHHLIARRLAILLISLATARLLNAHACRAAELTGSGTYHIPPAILPTEIDRPGGLDSLTGAILREEPTLIVDDGGELVVKGDYPGLFELRGIDAADLSRASFSSGSSLKLRSWNGWIYAADLAGHASAEFLPGSSLVIDGHSSNVIAFDLADDATLQYAGSAMVSVDGIAPVTFVRAAGRAHAELLGSVVILDDANSAITGLRADDFAFVQAGGQLHLIDHGNGFALGFRARGESSVIADGSFRLEDFGNDNAIGFIAEGAANVDFAGAIEVVEEGNGDAIGFTAGGTSEVRFSGEVVGQEFGNGVAVGFIADGSSKVHYSGAIHLEANNNGGGVGFRALGNAEVAITGGAIDLTLPRYPNESPMIFTAANSAVLEISGGQFGSTSGTPTPRFLASDESLVRFYGTSFNYPLGFVADLQGTLQGALHDGTEIELQFTRAAAAQIELIKIPEPAAAALFCLAILGAIGIIRLHNVPG